jgi:1-deoxy-D-xylulose-5-phosphate synthase
VLFCLDRAGLAGSDGATHHGIFDIAYLRCLPKFALMAPRDTGELVQMMDLAAGWRGPVAIRFPRGAGAQPSMQLPHAAFGFGESERVAEGEDGCLLAYGPMTYVALEMRRRIQARMGRSLSVVNARFAKPLDDVRIRRELARQPVLFTLEDHMVAGGFGAAVAELTLAPGGGRTHAPKIEILGLPDRFIDHGDRTEQLAEAGLGIAALTRRVAARLAGVSPAVRTVRRRASAVATGR